VLATREDLVVIARTDATDPEDRMRRAKAFAECGADGILVEALPNLELIKEIKKMVKCPMMVNQIAGGKSPSWSFQDLQKLGVSMVNYSTPCLFSAHYAIDKYLDTLLKTKVLPAKNTVTMDVCNKVLCNHLKNPI